MCLSGEILSGLPELWGREWKMKRSCDFLLDHYKIIYKINCQSKQFWETIIRKIIFNKKQNQFG